jgi:hypothetical protein
MPTVPFVPVPVSSARLRRCPRVHAVGVSPSPYASAEITFSGRVHGPVTSRRVPRPPWNARCLVAARSAAGGCGLGDRRCGSLSWTRPRTSGRPYSRGSAAKRGSPRAMDERPSRPKEGTKVSGVFDWYAENGTHMPDHHRHHRFPPTPCWPSMEVRLGPSCDSPRTGRHPAFPRR